jgi:hypothetical protein
VSGHIASVDIQWTSGEQSRNNQSTFSNHSVNGVQTFTQAMLDQGERTYSFSEQSVNI